MFTIFELGDLLIKSVSLCCEIAEGVVEDDGHPSFETIAETQETFPLDGIHVRFLGFYNRFRRRMSIVLDNSQGNFATEETLYSSKSPSSNMVSTQFASSLPLPLPFYVCVSEREIGRVSLFGRERERERKGWWVVKE